MEGGLWLLKISVRNVHWFVERLCSSHPSQLSRRRTLQSNQMRSDLPLRVGLVMDRGELLGVHGQLVHNRLAMQVAWGGWWVR